MAEDKRLENLQDEIKLLKGELKNSLASVRDYLLNMELPSSEFSTILAALSGEGGNSNGQKISMDGNLNSGKDEAPPLDDTAATTEETTEEPDELPPDEDLLDVAGPEEGMPEDLADETAGEEENLNPEDEMQSGEEEGLSPEDELSEEENLNPEDELQTEEEAEETGDVPEDEADEEDTTPEDELAAEEELPMEADRVNTDMNQGIPRVNMLANLINWVARAKREIGYEQLATFLDVYGVSGHLTPELKEVIIHLAEITQEAPEASTDADIWSQSMLSLHGILTGGDAPLHPVIPSWGQTAEDVQPAEEEIIEVDKKDRPLKLKLVLPDGDGQDKEFCIDLTPDNNNGNGKK